MLSEVPPLICDPKLTDEFVGYMKEMNIPGMMPYPGISASASEDFAFNRRKGSINIYVSVSRISG